MADLIKRKARKGAAKAAKKSLCVLCARRREVDFALFAFKSSTNSQNEFPLLQRNPQKRPAGILIRSRSIYFRRMKKPVVILLHLGYWMIYTLLLVVMLAGMLIDRHPGNVNKFTLAVFMFGFTVLPGLVAFYGFYTLLFTRLLQKKKLLLLFVFGILVAFAGALAGGVFMSLAINLKIMFADGFRSAWAETLMMGFIALIHGIIALVMRGFISWYGDIQLKEELNRKNYETELALMKAQINPHFLFNTLNNIDVLIRKDPDKASEYLNKLSDIMRFMLYETKTEKIPLEKELAYIEKYVELQRIRTSNPDYVSYSVKGDPSAHSIDPMFFIPFIENAFKHTENKKAAQAIRIAFEIEKDRLLFSCENKYAGSPQQKPEYGGLGSELIRKRLALLYPSKHRLTISDVNEIYRVQLEINFAA